MHRNQEAVADKTHQYAESAACKTPQQPASVARDIQIYKKVLGSRRSLATVFWSLSTATSDTQRERAFVKSVYASQHSQSKEEFCLQRSQPKEEFCPNAHSLRKSFTPTLTAFGRVLPPTLTAFGRVLPPTPTHQIFQKGAHNHGKMAKITLSTQPPSRS